MQCQLNIWHEFSLGSAYFRNAQGGVKYNTKDNANNSSSSSISRTPGGSRNIFHYQISRISFNNISLIYFNLFIPFVFSIRDEAKFQTDSIFFIFCRYEKTLMERDSICSKSINFFSFSNLIFCCRSGSIQHNGRFKSFGSIMLIYPIFY